ncbi:hypothetical protein LEP1GSC127_1142 [Leptospira kirschneri str. 200801925]|uniref:Uncharacterized protein n=1 Tax=Leptospira kirschneri str. 200802841 TaxID=1193047 RepID=A0A828Y644_9LEPT|nr:hypothetical protein LEP1GSC044_2605 [Leptospira kirschneri serovar Grippotyphosa str. RM52]EKO53227.1 hypothetical protein LEP1GSC131_0443 [Leptospira kirschneri str. 200802841]EMK02788.1 hypothetical protein LEP1GSC176_0713 [Leptospira kirschneri str. MMD1493]EMN24204.1 hypothetical protein LEP1GSC065_1558 [Leptospira kirschneri serovar Sokoine str. RM1]EMO74813.1 hypothetical protein LEP1GSC127_1142 [Leptospira kirschneri str. 200801925]EPG51434.1 hypothetical protein LEP1GSC049_1991 [Le
MCFSYSDSKIFFQLVWVGYGSLWIAFEIVIQNEILHFFYIIY